jgi:hypothetical protein
MSIVLLILIAKRNINGMVTIRFIKSKISAVLLYPNRTSIFFAIRLLILHNKAIKNEINTII